MNKLNFRNNSKKQLPKTRLYFDPNDDAVPVKYDGRNLSWNLTSAKYKLTICKDIY